MSWDQILKQLASEGAVIAGAPLSFAAALLVASGVVFLIARWMYSTVMVHKDARIATLEERVKLRDDQLSNKFQSTSPDEAKALITALQEQVSKLQPRRLTESQRQAISALARPPAGTKWDMRIRWYGLAFDGELYAEDFMTLFGQDLGWDVYGSREIGGGNLRGLVFEVGDSENPTDAERALLKAFQGAGIKVTVVQTPSAKSEPRLIIGYREDQ